MATRVEKQKSTASSGPAGIKPYKLQKNEEYMNDRQMAHFREILNMWKEQLLADIGRMVDHMQKDAANYPDPIDRASQEEEFSLELRTRDRERKLIRRIEEALDRIDNGEYGYCVDCGAEIGVKRLEARPIATQCIECKTVAEIREQHTGE